MPLTLWLVTSFIMLTGSDYESFIVWLKSPFVALSMLLLLFALFTHLALSLQVVIEDYVHSAAMIPLLIAVRFACVALALAGMLATLRVFFGNGSVHATRQSEFPRTARHCEREQPTAIWMISAALALFLQRWLFSFELKNSSCDTDDRSASDGLCIFLSGTLRMLALRSVPANELLT